MAIYEVDGEGANVYDSITIAPSPGYLIGSNADGFHSTDVAQGPALLNSRLTNIENDFFSTHSTMHVYISGANSHDPSGKIRGLLIDPRADTWANQSHTRVYSAVESRCD